MGSLYRSQEMSLIQLIMAADNAHSTVAQLGELGMVQFLDQNEDVSAFQRHFVKEVRKCDELERKIRFLRTQLERYNASAATPLLPTVETHYSLKRSPQELDELETRLSALEEEVNQVNKNEEVLNRNYGELKELQCVLEETKRFFELANAHPGQLLIPVEEQEQVTTTPLLKGKRETSTSSIPSGPIPGDLDSLKQEVRAQGMGFVTGVVEKKNTIIFERVLWRALRGNLYFKKADVDEPFTNLVTNETVEKCVFIIFAHGQTTLNKVRQICESFGAVLYPCPETAESRLDLENQVRERIRDMDVVISKTQEHRKRIFTTLAAKIDYWQTFVKHEKAIFHTMNLFNWDVTSKCLIAQGWCPTSDLPKIKDALFHSMELSGSNIPTILNEIKVKTTPPTYHRTNKFTSAFQTIVDSYGVASYREVNPALFSIITFPFLFAVMFGDIGHGFLMTLAAVFLVINEKKFAKTDYGEIFDTLFGGRYIILLMGIFSVYTGVIYNDIFSKGMAIFGESGWVFHLENGTESNYIGEFEGKVYPVGLDPGWHGADNYLIFTNSYKMKMSIVFGVMQMTFGIILSLMNHLYFKRYVSVFNEFLPQMIFLQSIFGYLTFTIIYKWCSDWTGRVAPSLLNMLIYMFLSPGKIQNGEYLYSGQETVQLLLLIAALIAVPWMLLVKPIYLLVKHKRQYRPIGELEEAEEEVSHGHGHGHGDGEFEFGELMVHQVIHTIEFCLGAISNTASYLRLWALSLAHAQLSAVLWNMTLNLFLSMEPGIMQTLGLFLGFGGWFALTVGILLIMEGLSAFLHALRLHWVEFNSKFYEGAGYKFAPFSFATLDEEVD